jgi:hypothetical protein
LVDVVTSVGRFDWLDIVLCVTYLLASVFEGTRHLLRTEFPIGVFDMTGATTEVALEVAFVFISCRARRGLSRIVGH